MFCEKNPLRVFTHRCRLWLQQCQKSLTNRLFWKRTGLFPVYLNLSQWSNTLFSVFLFFCIEFWNQGPRVWRGILCCLISSVKVPQLVMVWGEILSPGVRLLCFLKSKVCATIHKEMDSFAKSFMETLHLLSSVKSGPAQSPILDLITLI